MAKTKTKWIEDAAVTPPKIGQFSAGATAEKTAIVAADRVLIDDSEAGNAKKWAQVTNLAGGLVFGSHYADAESLGVTTMTSETFLQKVRLSTGAIPAGRYRIGWSYTWNHDSTQNDFEARVQQNDTTTLMLHTEEPTDALGDNPVNTGSDQKFAEGGFITVTLGAGSYDFDLDFRTTGAGDESSMWNARLEFWRVS